MELLQLPKVEVVAYDGNPLKYWTFIRSFENNIERASVDNAARLMRLMQYCTGKARQVIQGCCAMEPNEGYIKAKKLLKERFGNDYLITEIWVKKVTGGGALKAADHERLLDYSDELNNCVMTLKAMRKLSEINNQTNLLKIAEKLPVHLQNRWRKEARDIRMKKQEAPSIEDLAGFITRAAEEANDPVFGQAAEVRVDYKAKNDNRQASRPVALQARQRNFGIQMNSGAQANNVGSNDHLTNCQMCGVQHNLFQCNEFKGLTPEQRLKFTREKRLCDNCLRVGHKAMQCLKPTRCSVEGCGKKHTKFLHLPESRAAANTVTVHQQTSSTGQSQHAEAMNEVTCSLTGAGGMSRIALPVVPIKVTARGHSDYIIICALLDSGSTNTFCSEELKLMLGTEGRKEMISPHYKLKIKLTK
jgi:hypothetical protein